MRGLLRKAADRIGEGGGILAIHLAEAQIWLSVLSGGIVGFTLGLIGGGGSIMAVPLLLYLVGIRDPHIVIGSTALAVSANAYINTIPHWRAGNVKWRAAILFALPGVAGAYLGSTLGKLVNGKELLFLFAVLMLVIAVLMIRKKSQPQIDAPQGRTIRIGRVVPTGFVTGMTSGFFGIGGGFLIVPGLIFSGGLSMTEAIGTSLFSVGTFGLTTAVSYAMSGLVNWLVVLLYVGGGILGGIVGTKSCTALGQRKQALQWVFSGTITVVACYMLYVNLGALKLL